MTILRVGLSENKKYAAGYDAIFRKKKAVKAPKAKKPSKPKKKV